MKHDILWAPWRLAYIKGEPETDSGQGNTSPASAASSQPTLELPAGADPSCFLCRGTWSSNDRENLIAFRGEYTVTVLNRFPYNNGHLLVAPKTHKGNLGELTKDELLECMQTIARLIEFFQQKMNAQGFNVGLNLGRTAGAGLPGHLHWHVVPRWDGDTNFMPVLAGIRVIPQSLDALWEVLHAELKGERK